MQNLVICENSLDQDTWVSSRDIDVCDEIFNILSAGGAWPQNTYLYYGNVAESSDITPRGNKDALVSCFQKIRELDGDFFLVSYPGAAAIWVPIVIGLVSAAVSYFLVSSLPTATQRNRRAESPNNGLSDAQNQPRPMSRIPDIYGEVTAYPDMISTPYVHFENNREVELLYMLLGRGWFDYSASGMRWHETGITEMAGVSANVYGPNTTPFNSDTPELVVGTEITDKPYILKEIDAVDGQELRAPNTGTINGSSNIRFEYPDQIVINSSDVDPQNFFEEDESLTVTNGSVTVDIGGVSTTLDLSGTYTILALDSSSITLSNPSTTNSDWTSLDGAVYTSPYYYSPRLTTSSDEWVGPFLIDMDDFTQASANIVAVNGLYKDDGTQQIKANVQVQMELTPCDSSGTPTGSAETFLQTLEGSATSTGTRGMTVLFNPSFIGPCLVRMRRITNTDRDFEGTVVDEIKWRELYGMAPVPNDNSEGAVTTVLLKTYATSGALTVKKRRFNMDVTRKLPQHVSGSTFTTELFATKNIADILSAIAIDPYIGNLSLSSVDFDSIYDTIDSVESYFGTSDVVECGYTLDSDSLSFEETFKMFAGIAFCFPYRIGTQIQILFEKETSDSVVLFNHRCKVPDSETREYAFGYEKGYDGVDFSFVNRATSETESIYIPANQSAVNPKSIEYPYTITRLAAYFHAWREYNKLRYQWITVDFTSTQEGDIPIINERILVSDGTDEDTQDGYIRAQNGLELTMSQNVEFESGITYTIFLQHKNGTVESMACTAGTNTNQVVLAQAPAYPFVIDPSTYVQGSSYQIVPDTEEELCAFLLTEKTQNDGYTFGITAINYEDGYYENDKDYINEYVAASGYTSGQEQVIGDDGVVSIGDGTYYNPTTPYTVTYEDEVTGEQVIIGGVSWIPTSPTTGYFINEDGIIIDGSGQVIIYDDSIMQ